MSIWIIILKSLILLNSPQFVSSFYSTISFCFFCVLYYCTQVFCRNFQLNHTLTHSCAFLCTMIKLCIQTVSFVICSVYLYLYGTYLSAMLSWIKDAATLQTFRGVSKQYLLESKACLEHTNLHIISLQSPAF